MTYMITDEIKNQNNITKINIAASCSLKKLEYPGNEKKLK